MALDSYMYHLTPEEIAIKHEAEALRVKNGPAESAGTRNRPQQGASSRNIGIAWPEHGVRTGHKLMWMERQVVESIGKRLFGGRA
jgi:hypothetical protein